MSTETKYQYMHKDQKDFEMLTAKVYGDVATHKEADDLLTLLSESPLTGEKAAERTTNADRTLFGILLKYMGQTPQLTRVLSEYSMKGKDALDYLKKDLQGGAEDAMDTNLDEYIDIESTEIPVSTPPSEVLDKLSTMCTLKERLKGTDAQLTNKLHSVFMIRVVRRMSKAHRREVELANMRDKLDAPNDVMLKLSNILKKLYDEDNREQSSRPIPAFMVEHGITNQAELEALLVKARGGGRQPTRAKCPKCNRYHAGPCFVTMLKEGKIKEVTEDPRWKSMSSTVRQEIAKQAGVEVSVNICMPMALQASGVGSPKDSQTPPPVPRALPGDVVLSMDSKAGNGTNFHFITDKQLFVSWMALPNPMPIGGFGGHTKATHVGTIMFKTRREGFWGVLHNCLYVPGGPQNLLNQRALMRNGVYVDPGNTGDAHVVLPDARGAPQKIHLDNEYYTFAVTPPDASMQRDIASAMFVDMLAAFAANPQFESLQTGKHGPLHLRMARDERDQAELALWRDRFNDPGVQRLRRTTALGDGAPKVVETATQLDVMTDARLRSLPPSVPAKVGSLPKADYVGHITQSDICTMPVTSILGNSKYIAFWDAATSHPTIYPIRAKSQSPDA